MAYPSIDKLQVVLADEIFGHTQDRKKAAGRALGTFIEIITYYLLKSWGLNHQISIERGLPEYGNRAITHNVEFSLHPVVREHTVLLPQNVSSITANTIIKALVKEGIFNITTLTKTSKQLLKGGVLRNACTIATSADTNLLCSIKENKDEQVELHVYEQRTKSYAVVECKRVGVEEGMSKGPQTIEKAKQGAYVARTTSSLQKLRNEAGEMQGIIYKSSGEYVLKPYKELMEEVVFSDDAELLREFILTIGVVSNHGNWIKRDEEGNLGFSDELFHKELLVLAQSYDWLLFLTDAGLGEFIDRLLLNPTEETKAISQAFLTSYTPAEGKKGTQFTKVQMKLEADTALLEFFRTEAERIEEWFTVISPSGKTLLDLREELEALNNKNWQEILK